jgi:hypothetical protein
MNQYLVFVIVFIMWLYNYKMSMNKSLFYKILLSTLPNSQFNYKEVVKEDAQKKN